MGESSVHWERKVNAWPGKNNREEPIVDTLSHIQYGKRCNEALRIVKLDTGLVRINLMGDHLMGIHSDCAQGKF